MTTASIIEIAFAAALIIGGVWLQVRGRRADPSHGSQGAVILLILGAILAVHGLGLLDYQPMGSPG